MNAYKTNCAPQFAIHPIHQKTNTTFLTTNLPLAVQENTKTAHHSSSAVSRRVFGPNDMVVMTTRVEKHIYSTMKSTTVGKPVVSDSVHIPNELLCVGRCLQNVPPANCIPPPPSEGSTTGESSVSCPIPETCINPKCLGGPKTNTSSQTSNDSSLIQVISQLEDDSTDQNEMCTDSEDEFRSDSEDEDSDCTGAQ